MILEGRMLHIPVGGLLEGSPKEQSFVLVAKLSSTKDLVLEPASHGDVVRISSNHVASNIAFQEEDMTRSTRRDQNIELVGNGLQSSD